MDTSTQHEIVIVEFKSLEQEYMIDHGGETECNFHTLCNVH